eukprot:6871364-Prymnesium_polylepis.1
MNSTLFKRLLDVSEQGQTGLRPGPRRAVGAHPETERLLGPRPEHGPPRPTGHRHCLARPGRR